MQGGGLGGGDFLAAARMYGPELAPFSHMDAPNMKINRAIEPIKGHVVLWGT